MSVRHSNAPDIEGHVVETGTIMAAMLAPGILPLTEAAYGELVITGNAVATSLPTTGDWVKVAAGWAPDEVNGVTLDAGAGTMTVVQAGAYQTLCAIAFTSADTPQTVEFGIFKNGALIPDHLVVSWTDTDTYPNTLTITGIDGLSTGDVLDLRARCTTADSVALTVTEANFNIFTIGGVKGDPGSSDLDVILTASAGEDVADALSGATTPSATNLFLTGVDVAVSTVSGSPIGNGYIGYLVFDSDAKNLYGWGGADYIQIAGTFGA
jgi:hypothetical protein